MTGKVIYEVVEHDGGWAYKVGDVLSETFATHDEALAAAKMAAARQQLPDETHDIEYQGDDNRWHLEQSPGNDRPITTVNDL
jgi:hypothetical protein